MPKETMAEFSAFIRGLGVRDFFYLRVYHSGNVSDTTYTAQYSKTIQPTTALMHSLTFLRFVDSTELAIKRRTKENASNERIKSIPSGRGITASGTIKLGADIICFAVAGVNHQKTRELAAIIRSYIIAPYSTKA